MTSKDISYFSVMSRTLSMLIDRLISRVKFDLIEFPNCVRQTLTISNVNQITLIR